MFGSRQFGTTRFGESPAAVSPVLLSGIGIQGVGVGVVGLTVEKRVVVSQGITVGAVGATVAVGRNVSGRGVQGVRGWVSSVGIERRLIGVAGQGSAVVLLVPGVGKVLVSNSGTASLTDVHVRTTISLASGSATATESNTTIAFPGLVLSVTQGSRCNAYPTILRRLASDPPSPGCHVVVSIQPTIVLASSSTTATTSRMSIAFSGLALWVTQGSWCEANPEILRRLASDTSLPGGRAGATMIVSTALASSSGTWAWAGVSVLPAGLLILNVQSSNNRGLLSAERRLRGKSVERDSVREIRIQVMHRFVGSGYGGAAGSVVSRGKVLVLQAIQTGIITAIFPVMRGIAAHGADRERTAATLTKARDLRIVGLEAATVVLTPNVYRTLSAEEMQGEFMRAILGRVRTLGGYGYEVGFPFGRFAVVPDLTNDRLVIILRESRRVVIPRQAET